MHVTAGNIGRVRTWQGWIIFLKSLAKQEESRGPPKENPRSKK